MHLCLEAWVNGKTCGIHVVQHFRMPVFKLLTQEACSSAPRSWVIIPLKSIEYGVYGDLIIIYPTPYSIYLRGTILITPLVISILFSIILYNSIVVVSIFFSIILT